MYHHGEYYPYVNLALSVGLLVFLLLFKLDSANRGASVHVGRGADG